MYSLTHGVYSIPKPSVFSTAITSLCSSAAYVGYGDRSIRLKHVCALGSESGSLPDTYSIVNFFGPKEPCEHNKSPQDEGGV